MENFVGHIGNIINIYKFLEELGDKNIFMKEDHSSEGEYLTIRFMAVDSRSIVVRLFSSYILWSSIKPWTVNTRTVFSSGYGCIEWDLQKIPKEIDRFEQIIVKFPKTSSGKQAYNTMVNAYHNLDLVNQFKVLTYLKHLCDPHVSSFRKADFRVIKLSGFSELTLSDPGSNRDMSSFTDYYTNFKMELTIS
jgi:hypothetical protein